MKFKWFSSHFLLLFSVVLAFGLGLIFQDHGSIFEPFGHLFLNLLRMMIIPLVVSSIIVAINHLKTTEKLSQYGVNALLYCIMSSIIAIGLGLLIGLLAKPGANAAFSARFSNDLILSEKPTLSTLFLESVPDNLYTAFANENMLAVLFFSIVFGIAILTLGKKGARVVEFFEGLYAVFLRMTEWILAISPIGVFCLVFPVVSSVGWGGMKPLSFFVISVLIGLIIYSIVIIPLFLRFLVNVSPTHLFTIMSPALLTVFSTASNAATLPISLSCMAKSKTATDSASQFFLPLGITVNMNGSSIFLVISVLFIAQIYGTSLSVMDYVLIAVISYLGSIATAALPGASLITLILVLTSIGLPIDGIGIILVVDRLLDMVRSSANLWSNAAGVEFIARFGGSSPRPPMS